MPSRTSRLSSAITTRTASPRCTACPPPGGLADAQAPVERLDAVGEAAQPGAARRRPRRRRRRRRPRSRRRPSRAATRRVAAVALGVLADVGQRLGDDEVRGDLDRLGQPAGQLDATAATGTGARAASASQRGAEPVAASTAGCSPRASSRSSSQRRAPARRAPRSSCSAARRGRCGCGAASSRSSSASATSRCCAPSCRLRSSRRRSASAGLDDPRRASPAAPPAARAARPAGARSRARSPAAARDRVEQLGLVVAATGRARAPRRARPSRSISVVARPSPRAASVDRAARRRRPSCRTRAASTRAQRRVAQRARERVAQVGRRRARPQLDEQLADRRARQPGVQQPDQEGDRREPDRRRTSRAGSSRTRLRRRRSPKRRRNRNATITRPRANASTSSAEPARAAAAPRPPAQAQTTIAGERTARSSDDELGPQQRRTRRRALSPTASRLSGPKPPSAMPTSWSPTRDDVGDGRRAAGSTRALQPAAREGQEHVQEQRGGHEVEGDPDRERDRRRSADERIERKIVKPAATISGPKRLSGRRHHATTPEIT